MSTRDHLPVVFQESLTMVEAGDKIRSYLHLEDEMIVNHLELIGYDRHGNLVEYRKLFPPRQTGSTFCIK